MNGKLVPVREKVIPGHGVRYVVDDKRYADSLGYPIESGMAAGGYLNGQVRYMLPED